MGTVVKKENDSMKECLCSIFDTREERLVEPDGRVIRRLICNVCGRILDSKEEKEPVSTETKKGSQGNGEREAASM